MRKDGFEKTYSRVILSRISRGSENHPIRPGSCWWMAMSRKQSIIAWSSSSMLRLEADCLLPKTVKMMHSRCCEILAVLKTDGGMMLETCAAGVRSRGVKCRMERSDGSSAEVESCRCSLSIPGNVAVTGLSSITKSPINRSKRLCLMHFARGIIPVLWPTKQACQLH